MPVVGEYIEDIRFAGNTFQVEIDIHAFFAKLDAAVNGLLSLRAKAEKIIKNTTNGARYEMAQAFLESQRTGIGALWLREHSEAGLRRELGVCDGKNRDYSFSFSGAKEYLDHKAIPELNADLEKRAEKLYGAQIRFSPFEVAAMIDVAIQNKNNPDHMIEGNDGGFGPEKVPHSDEIKRKLYEKIEEKDEEEISVVCISWGGTNVEVSKGKVSAAGGIEIEEFKKMPLGDKYCNKRQDLWENIIPAEAQQMIKEAGDNCQLIIGTAMPVKFDEEGNTYVGHWAGKVKGQRDIVGPSSQAEARDWERGRNFPSLEQSVKKDFLESKGLNNVKTVRIGHNDAKCTEYAGIYNAVSDRVDCDKIGGGIGGTGSHYTFGPFITESGHVTGHFGKHVTLPYQAALYEQGRKDIDVECLCAGKILCDTLMVDMGSIKPDLEQKMREFIGEKRENEGRLVQVIFDMAYGIESNDVSQFNELDRQVMMPSVRRLVENNRDSNVLLLAGMQKYSGCQVFYVDGSLLCHPAQINHLNAINTELQELTGIERLVRVAEPKVSGKDAHKVSRTHAGLYMQALGEHYLTSAV